MKRILWLLGVLAICIFLASINLQAGPFDYPAERATHTSVSVSSYAVTEVCAVMPGRIGPPWIQNRTATLVYVYFSYTAVTSTQTLVDDGWQIAASGTLDVDEDYTGAVYGFGNGTTIALDVLEFYR